MQREGYAVTWLQDGVSARGEICDPAFAAVVLDTAQQGERARVFERFYRGSQQQQGCGIGLSIVARVDELSHADIRPRAPATGSGLIVEMCFPVS